MIAIVTETLSCMNVIDCAAYGVSLAPLDCVIGDRTESDHIITGEVDFPTGQGHSLAPTVEEYLMRFEVLLKDFDGVLCITASCKFSDSNRHARMAAASLGGRVQVIDSASVAGGLFLLVLRARHLIALEYPVSRICAELESYKNNLCVSFTAENAESLRLSKRLSYKMPVGRPILSQNPVFRIQNGGIGFDTSGADERQIVDEMLGALKQPSHIVIHYADRTKAVEYLLERIEMLFPTATVYERPITLSLQLNLGHKIMGIVGD